MYIMNYRCRRYNLVVIVLNVRPRSLHIGGNFMSDSGPLRDADGGVVHSLRDASIKREVDWHERISPILSEIDKKIVFSIYVYSSALIRNFLNINKIRVKINYYLWQRARLSCIWAAEKR